MRYKEKWELGFMLLTYKQLIEVSKFTKKDENKYTDEYWILKEESYFDEIDEK